MPSASATRDPPHHGFSEDILSFTSPLRQRVDRPSIYDYSRDIMNFTPPKQWDNKLTLIDTTPETRTESSAIQMPSGEQQIPKKATCTSSMPLLVNYMTTVDPGVAGNMQNPFTPASCSAPSTEMTDLSPQEDSIHSANLNQSPISPDVTAPLMGLDMAALRMVQSQKFDAYMSESSPRQTSTYSEPVDDSPSSPEDSNCSTTTALDDFELAALEDDDMGFSDQSLAMNSQTSSPQIDRSADTEPPSSPDEFDPVYAACVRYWKAKKLEATKPDHPGTPQPDMTTAPSKEDSPTLLDEFQMDSGIDAGSSFSSVHTDDTDDTDNFQSVKPANLADDDVFGFDDPANDVNRDTHIISKTKSWEWYARAESRDYFHKQKRSKVEKVETPSPESSVVRHPYKCGNRTRTGTAGPSHTRDGKKRNQNTKRYVTVTAKGSPINRRNRGGDTMMGNTTPIREAH